MSCWWESSRRPPTRARNICMTNPVWTGVSCRDDNMFMTNRSSAVKLDNWLTIRSECDCNFNCDYDCDCNFNCDCDCDCNFNFNFNCNCNLGALQECFCEALCHNMKWKAADTTNPQWFVHQMPQKSVVNCNDEGKWPKRSSHMKCDSPS